MKTVIWALIFIVLFLYLAGTTITLHPFSVKFKSLYLALGLAFFILSILCYQYHYYNKGIQDTIEYVKNAIDEAEKS